MMSQDNLFDAVCDLKNLALAWRQVRGKAGAAGVSRRGVEQFERRLYGHLDNLALRLSDGGYQPNDSRETKWSENIADEFILIEDLIVQRALFNAIAPMVEPEALNPGFGYQPVVDSSSAVKCVLGYRMKGGVYVSGSSIADLHQSLDADIVMQALESRIKNGWILDLVGMWLDSGQLLPNAFHYPGNQWMTSPVKWAGASASSTTAAFNTAVARLLDMADDLSIETDEFFGETEAERLSRLRHQALKRIGVNTAVFALATAVVMVSPSRIRKLFTPKSMAVTGAALMATVAYPSISRFVRDRFGGSGWEFIEMLRPTAALESPLANLLANLVLREFDAAMAKNRWPIVRLNSDFVVISPDSRSAALALETAAHHLGNLRLSLDPQASYIARFDQGVEAFGYEFHKRQIAARENQPQTSIYRQIFWPKFQPDALKRLDLPVANLGARAKKGLQKLRRRVQHLF